MIADLKPYPAMKDSGMPWLGAVPWHWEMELGKWLFRKMNRPIWDASEVVTCFRDGIVTLRKNRRVRGFTESLKEIGYQGIRRGDLVIHGMDAFAGAIGVADSDGKGTPVYSVCEPGPTANAQYYAFALREMARSQWIQALAKGIRERSTDFRFEGFGSQPVPLPPLCEQAAIVRYLDHADRRIRCYIRAKQKLIALLEEQKQAIIHRAVTRGLDPNVRLKPSGVGWLGDIPEHWKILPLKRWVSTKITDGPHETPALLADGIPFMSAESMVGGRLDFSRRRGFISREQHEVYCRKCRPRRDDIFMCKSGATTGKVAIVETADEFSVWSPLALIRVESHKVLARLLFAVLQTRYVQQQVQDTWSYGTQPNLAMRAMERLVVVLPPIDEQQEVLAHLDRATKKPSEAIDRAHREIVLLREYRTRLIADVVTGKLDVRGAAEGLPEVDPLADEFDAPIQAVETGAMELKDATESPEELAMENEVII